MNDIALRLQPSRPAALRDPEVSGRGRYWAFLSYSHEDRKWADWLHRALESYRVPKELAGGGVPERLAPIFRDRDELPASGDLAAEIRAALAEARFLIVLCSPAAAASRWTDAEIAEFKRLHPGRQVLAAIVGGEPFASDMPGREAEECFPEALRRKYGSDGCPTGARAEPIAADLRPQGDGRRLGLLKLAAGMLGVGLDRLVRRESQRRHRRLTFIAAASAAGMAVTSALAVAAIDARDEAQDQREEAEELVGFMLGDLRGKLEPLGRLDVLDAVGAEALGYYQRQDRGALTEESLAQQTRALTLIGEIANRRGDLDGALTRFREAQASTAEAMARSPGDEQRIFDHAQNVFWVGYIAWQRGQIREAEAAFREYKRLAERLIALNPAKSEWRLEGVYAGSNLGTLLLEQRKYPAAIDHFRSALGESEKLAAAAPRDVQYQMQFSESLAWLADAQERSGELDTALRTRERELEILAMLAKGDSSNAAVKRRTFACERALGRLLASRGQLAAGLAHLRSATQVADALRETEPENTEWLEFAARTHLEYGDLLLASSRLEDAGRNMREGCEIAEDLVRRDPSVVAWQQSVLRNCLLLRARVAAAAGERRRALGIVQQALALSPAMPPRPEAGGTSQTTSALHLFAGDQYAALGERPPAQRAWKAALAHLPAEAAATPYELAMRSGLLARLGRAREAEPIAGRLAEMGYRHPAQAPTT